MEFTLKIEKFEVNEKGKVTNIVGKCTEETYDRRLKSTDGKITVTLSGGNWYYVWKHPKKDTKRFFGCFQAKKPVGNLMHLHNNR